jgi:hypothetical protein
MTKPELLPNPPMYQAFRVAYALGLVLCVLWPLALQVLLTRLVPNPGGTAGDLALELGYGFTGLTVLTALDPPRQARTLFREIILAAALFELCAVYGILTYAMGGPHAERYGRTFLLLPALMFLVFVPGWKKWRTAAQA